jgi:hypothetical protein
MHGDVETLQVHAEHAPTSRLARRRGIHGRRSRVRTPLGLTALVLALMVAGGLTWWALSGPGAPSTPTASPRQLALGVSTVRQATATVTAAGTTMSVGMNDLSGLPTVPTVSAVVDPYARALQAFQLDLSGVAIDPLGAARRRTVLVQVGPLLAVISKLGGTPSAQLGTWIDNFYLETAELQSAIEDLQTAVGSDSGR